jgi:phospholipid transport system substrate-binding protein
VGFVMMPTLALRRPWATGLACLLVVGLAAAPRGAAAEAPGPEALIVQLGTEGLAALRPGVAPGLRAARFRQLFESDFALPEIARFVLGPYGRALTPQQQDEFRRLFGEYLARSYARKLEGYAGDRFRVIGSRPWGDDTLVYSQVARPGGEPIALDWLVSRRGGRYRITDVYVDRVSMKLDVRNRFTAIIARNGGEAAAVIAALRQQLAVGS